MDGGGKILARVSLGTDSKFPPKATPMKRESLQVWGSNARDDWEVHLVRVFLLIQFNGEQRFTFVFFLKRGVVGGEEENRALE